MTDTELIISLLKKEKLQPVVNIYREKIEK